MQSLERKMNSFLPSGFEDWTHALSEPGVTENVNPKRRATQPQRFIFVPTNIVFILNQGDRAAHLVEYVMMVVFNMTPQQCYALP
jgi:hypothetical protein